MNRLLLRKETSELPAFSAFFHMRAAAGELPDDSNFTQIFGAFESALNQTRPVSPTAFSAAAAIFNAGNKTKRDVTGEE